MGPDQKFGFTKSTIISEKKGSEMFVKHNSYDQSTTVASASQYNKKMQ